MQDLLNEKEFLKKPYNPWKLFYTFYGIAIIQLVLFVVIVLFAGKGPGVENLIALLLLPNLTALAMFFLKKKNAKLLPGVLATATAILFCIYYIPLTLFAIAGGATIIEVAELIVVGIGSFFLCFAIMYFSGKAIQQKSTNDI